MFAKGNINKKLIAKYLTGNCSLGEKNRVEQWINASVKNAAQFNQYKTIWTYAAPPADIPALVTKDALASVRGRIEKLENTPSVVFKPKHKNKALQLAYKYSSRVAAVLLIALTAYFFLNTETEVKTTTFTAEAKVLDPVILPDGSKVYLNAGATLIFPESFDKTDRHVKLDGEAFFEVESDPSWPFVVTTGNLGIKVLGTAFNINAGSLMETVEVAISEGKVQFYSFDTRTGDIREQIILTQGEKGIYYKNSGQIARTILQNDNCIGWKSGILVFDNTPLPDVLKALEHAYELKFHCEHDFSNLSLTARFNQEEPGNIIETLRLIFGFQIEKSDNQVRIF